jgi:glucan 1,3-beta-glucosidase
VAPNEEVPALDKPWGSYATTPARGVNVGGWLSLEPFITPSLFQYDSGLGIVDEYTLCAHLGADCAAKLEDHYATFVNEQTFADIAAAGLDHVRIPFSYWAVQTYDSDPYVFRTSWRYLLRGIEWCRKYGLRVNLDLHGIPGSQNGWNHSGRLGAIGWMNGTAGAANVKRSLEIHDRLSKFFAQDRYKNIITHYGLANEPRMTFLPVADVMAWTQQAASMIRRNGMTNAIIVFGDGFMGLGKWTGQPNANNLAVDVHQYLIFNNALIVFSHAEKIKYACDEWSKQTSTSMNTATGYGAIVVAEWSQADTDCAPWLGNVGNGARWTGSYDVGNDSLNALTPRCPTKDNRCDCNAANADPSRYSAAYKQFLLMFAEAQMHAFEKGMGWWYWTWDTESAPQVSNLDISVQLRQMVD